MTISEMKKHPLKKLREDRLRAEALGKTEAKARPSKDVDIPQSILDDPEFKKAQQEVDDMLAAALAKP